MSGDAVPAGRGRYTLGMQSGERLQKFLARAGVASRRKAEELIRAGRVTVDGRRAELGSRVGPGSEVRLDGRIVRDAVERVTYMLNKPPGLLSTVTDPRGRPTVMSLVPDVPGLHPVGRLDLDSEGLLLLTTDGDLTMRLTHPRFEHPKEYRVWCAEGKLDRAACERLEAGVELEDGPARAVSARPAPGGGVIVLEEGRKRQVRRMLAAVGCEVTRLQRTRIGELRLGGLPAGECRRLSEAEIAAATRTGGR